jgi:hypothetical protein
MQRRSILFLARVSRIERQECDLGCFRQINGLIVDDKLTGVHSALQRQAIAVILEDAAQEGARHLSDMEPKSLPGCYPSRRNQKLIRETR